MDHWSSVLIPYGGKGWLGSTPERRRPQIRGFRAGGSLAVASSTPATQPPPLPGFVGPPSIANQPRLQAENCEWGQEEPRWNVAIECRCQTRRAGRDGRRPSQKPPSAANCCHFVAAKPLRPLQPFYSHLAPQGLAGLPVIGHWSFDSSHWFPDSNLWTRVTRDGAKRSQF
jgi:hypothetical protein